ncbi:MAG: diguanylate cyclase [Arcobacteraceae bacterium]|nr:diguanylate cyclase [Arcobacteraceae bacterium]
MTKIIDLKEFSYFLRVHRNSIIQNWTETNEVKNIIHKHSVPVIEKNKNIFYEFCDCFISIFQWDFTISECQARMTFLKLLEGYGVTSAELFILILRLKSSVEDIIYQDGSLSYNIQKELETITIDIALELTDTYNSLQREDKDNHNEQSNLLAEYKKAVDISNIVSKTNPKGIITYVNDKFCQISGYKKEELIGKAHNIIRHPSMDRESFKELWDTVKSKKPWTGIVTNMAKDGSSYVVDTTVIPILDVDGDIVEFIAVRHDITDFEKTKEQLQNINKVMKNKVDELYSVTSSLEEKATRDELTGLYNRAKFEEIFSYEINKAKHYNNQLSVILFDIDHFKNINDTYGHQAGDVTLKELSSLITKNIKTSDIFARWGGEEFIILLPDTNRDGAMQFAQKLRKIIKENKFSDIEYMTASFGVAQFEEYEDKLTLFEKVDKALYIAKNNGRDRVEQSLFNCVH